ncbi:MAG TPA: DUF932 domain-containing protein [Methanosarcina sp.]|nr:DUF932 domain-containing protein [Methanosarcina sp.]
MAHELTQRKNGFVEFAFAGPRQAIWHSLGSELQEGASIETWIDQAGMDWSIDRSPVMYHGKAGIVINENQHVLHRSDTEELLGIVSKDYKVVQPAQVLEFFRDLTEIHGMKLSAAGTLQGGKKYWATAEVGKSAQIVDGDNINGQLLLVSSADGTLSTSATFTSTRTVCMNTLRIALGNAKNAVKVTHAADFDAKKVKIDLGVLDTAWDGFITNLKTLASKKIDDRAAEDFFAKLITPVNESVDMELLKTQRHVDAMMHFFKNGAGSEMHYGTMWGLMNGCSEALTHGTGKRNASAQFDRSEFGVDAKMKMEAYNRLVAMAA